MDNIDNIDIIDIIFYGGIFIVVVVFIIYLFKPDLLTKIVNTVTNPVTNPVQDIIDTNDSINCTWSPISYGICNATCNGTSATSQGTRTVTYTKTREAANGGSCTPPSSSQSCTKTDCPTITNNGEYYDYAKLNIKPTITLIQPTVLNIPTVIKGSITSNIKAGDEYKNYYVRYSGSKDITIFSFDKTIEKSELKPEVKLALENNDNIFEWKDVKTPDLCYIPENYIPEKDDYAKDRNNKIVNSRIILGKCTENNAKYKMINGYIQHIHSNTYLIPESDKDLPPPNDKLLLTNNLIMREVTVKDNNNKSKTLEFPEFLLVNGEDINKYKFIYENNKLKHLASSKGGTADNDDTCLLPICPQKNTIDYNCNNKIYLSLVKCKQMTT
jgi:hypothetical protein